ncbi:cytochrome c biogenesis protein CcmG/thiol:disulfide interchange protein DsbE [Fluviicoccus keumensis]|uniref:Cytochrome c biogenesis protein CcmG/thiol:disulfide interchange protein DsbE n=1 Tax=Fluviicoccus keumensis TaxID=1435465 RepID=A0A4Q7YIS9_9GAMM|nr:DsbE family thiol:disulfide interchange protein [Fluviicoccus keumensis]RZU37140.1 cytochrome c biogenesis protein CcmG/thiol:disulfide interchange protein DsbE [Fluviicoccus keumensis]
MKSRALLWGIPLLIFVGFSVLLFSRLGKDSTELPSARLGKPFPEFRLPSLLDGHELTAADVRGKAIVVNVWASWCPSCRQEHPSLMKLAAAGVPVIGLNYKDAQADAQGYLSSLGNPFVDVISDTDGSLGLDLGVYGAPETYLLDANGHVRYRFVGVFDDNVWKTTLQPCFDQLQKGGEAPACQF